jgi:hypothetical protein
MFSREESRLENTPNSSSKAITVIIYEVDQTINQKSFLNHVQNCTIAPQKFISSQQNIFCMKYCCFFVQSNVMMQSKSSVKSAV